MICHPIVSSAANPSLIHPKECTIDNKSVTRWLPGPLNQQADKIMGTILVIEDDARILKALQRLFSSEGYEIRSAGNGIQGLELFAAPGLDAAVLDLMLPGMSGRDICR